MRTPFKLKSQGSSYKMMGSSPATAHQTHQMPDGSTMAGAEHGSPLPQIGLIWQGMKLGGSLLAKNAKKIKNLFSKAPKKTITKTKTSKVLDQYGAPIVSTTEVAAPVVAATASKYPKIKALAKTAVGALAGWKGIELGDALVTSDAFTGGKGPLNPDQTVIAGDTLETFKRKK